MKKLEMNWKPVVAATFAVLIVAFSLAMDFCLYDMVKENRIIIENILDYEK